MNRKHLHIAVTAGLMAALSLGAAAVPAFAEETAPSAVEETIGESAGYNASAMATEAQDSISRSSSIPGLPDHADPGDIVYQTQPSMIYEAVADEDGVIHYSINAVEGYLEFPTLRVFKYMWTQWADDQGNPTGEGDWVVQNAYGTECETTWTVSGYDGELADLPAGTYTAVGTTVSDEEEFSGQALEVTVNIVEADQVAAANWNPGPYTYFTTNEEEWFDYYPTMWCTLYDGRSLDLAVEWDPVDMSEFEQPGTVTVNGEIEGTDISVYLTYNVYTPVGVGSVSDDWTFAGYPSRYEDPEVFVLAEGPNGIEEVSPSPGAWPEWDDTQVDYDAPGEYKITGNLVCGEVSYPISSTVVVYEMPDEFSDFMFSDSGKSAMSVWTEPGEAPLLPAYIWARNPGGNGSDIYDSEEFDIIWDEVDPALYAEDRLNTSFTVKGKISTPARFADEEPIVLSGIEVECTVYVADLAQEFVPEIVTMPGVAPELPRQMTVKSSDGREYTFTNLYSSVPEELYSTPGNTFTVDVNMRENTFGAYSYGKLINRQITVHVADTGGVIADDAAADNLLTLTCKQGTAPELPQMFPVELENGSVVPAAVEWEELSVDRFSEPGTTVDVRGTVQNAGSLPEEAQIALAATGGEVVAKVTVAFFVIKPMCSFIEPEYAYVEVGSSVDVNDSAFGHSEVTAVLSDGSSYTADVAWNDDGLDLSKPGSYLLEGELQLDEVESAMFSNKGVAYMYVNVVDSDAPDPDPDPDPDPTPDPEPTPDPDPNPDPTPEPTPDPDPVEDVDVPEAEGGSVEVEPVPAGETATVVCEPESGQEVREVVVIDSEGNPVETAVDEDGNVTFEMPEGGATVEVVFGCDGGELCGTHAFPDIDQDEWYHDSVDWAIEGGVFHGYDDGTFGPDDVLTREQAAAVLYNYLGGEPGAPGSGLSDVSEDWYTDAVNWAVANGIMTGYEGAGAFGVGDALTREQFCSVVAKAMGADLEGVDASVLDGFSDADSVSGWARSAVAWAVQAGVVNGVENPDGTRSLQGARDITRAEMAAMMKNAVDAGVLTTA